MPNTKYIYSRIKKIAKLNILDKYYLCLGQLSPLLNQLQGLQPKHVIIS